MNKKKRIRIPEDRRPVFLYEIPIVSGSKTYSLVKDMEVSVVRKPGLRAGRYQFLYAEKANIIAETLIVVEGPMSAYVGDRRRKVIRESDIKQVHLGTRPK
jgi:hypothetical protein